MPQEYIDQFLRYGSNTENHRTRIAIEYAKQQPMDYLTDFLEKTYHGGYGLQFGTTKVCAWYAENGMHLAYGSAARYARNAQILSWEDVAVRVGELLEQGQFATNVELAECRTFEKRQLAEQLWYMSHDISEKAVEAGHMSIVRSLRGGFPEETEKLMVFLSEPESYQAIMRQVYTFRDACNADKGMMGGYTKMVEKMLDGIEVRLNVDYLEDKAYWDSLADKVVYTGPIDAYFGFRFGPLSYRSIRFETEVLDMPNFQGNAVVNYTDRETPYTRIIEHKHFEFGNQPKTVISREYSQEWQPGMEPYYPINDEKNTALYRRYRTLAEGERDAMFGGRLGEYRYYDMDAVVLCALDLAEKEKEGTL